jgi:8-oxo-dGTP diphosphatase
LLLVTAAIIVRDGKIFAARRAANKHLAGFWEFPGGKLEINESPEQCLARELREEFGLEASIGDFFMESTYRYDEKLIRLLAYWVSLHGTIDEMNDHDENCWMESNCLQRLKWAPADKPIVDALQGGGNELLVGKSKPDI